MKKLTKIFRFAFIYGPRRALVKAMGRLRMGRIGLFYIAAGKPGVGLIGCGQFAFATIGYFLCRRAFFVSVFDIDSAAAQSLARTYGAGSVAKDAEAVVADPAVRYVYIASNHASHTDYAIQALQAGKVVYVEKPVSVSHAQLSELQAAVAQSAGPIYAGYNRPFSGAVRDIRELVEDTRGPLTLSCFISGHVIPPDHWYRRPGEGTRVCGNLGHWLDLAVHLLSWRGLPDRLKISVLSSDERARDDDLAVALATDQGDLVNIVLTARTEPFEGINETINLQWGDVISRIDDFRRQTVWKGRRVIRKRYWPKDVGHKRAILQPFSEERRPWSEVVDSSLLMLRIKEMVESGETIADFSFVRERERLADAPHTQGTEELSS